MKRILMLTAAFCVWGTVSQAAKPFNGWSVGAHGGWNQTRADIDLSKIRIGALQLENRNVSINSCLAGLHLDWTKSRANDFLFGIGLNIGYGFGASSGTQTDKKNVVVTPGITANAKVDFEVKRKLYVELSTRLGWNFDNKWALYAILAARTQRSSLTLSTKFDSNGVELTEKNTSNDTIGGFAPGIGFDVHLNDRWSMGAQYKYYFESSSKTKVFKSDTKPIKFNSHDALVKVSYHF